VSSRASAAAIRAHQGKVTSTCTDESVPSHDHQYITWVLVSMNKSLFDCVADNRMRAPRQSFSPMSNNSPRARSSTATDMQTKTVEEARAAVQAACVPPFGGGRSIAPNALLWGYNDAPNMFEVWDRAAVIIQIESEEGALVADQMAAIHGGESARSVGRGPTLVLGIVTPVLISVDGLMIGPGDLSMNLGVDYTTAFTDPRFIK